MLSERNQIQKRTYSKFHVYEILKIQNISKKKHVGDFRARDGAGKNFGEWWNCS